MRLLKTCGIACVIASVLTGAGDCAKTRQDLLNEIAKLKTEVATLKQTVGNETARNVQAVNAIAIGTAKPLSATVGIISADKGTTLNLPVYFKSGAKPVAALEFAITLSTVGVSILSVSPGEAALNASKSVQGTLNGANYRVIVFGLNQTPIGSGPIANVKLTIKTSAGGGKRPISISGVLGSDPSGISVTLAGNPGSLTIR